MMLLDHVRHIWRPVLVAGLLACLPASATTTTTFAFECAGTGTGGGLSYQDSGSGTVSPFGSAGFSTSGTITPTSLTGGTVAGTMTVTLSDGDSFTGTYSGDNITVTSTGAQASGTATITSGTGQFQNASGSLNFIFVAVNTAKHATTFTVTGSGSITTTNPVLYHYVIAHFPFGAGWSTLVFLNNDGTNDATVNIAFFNQTGAGTSVPLQGLGTQSSQELVVHANSTETIGADLSQRNSLPATQIAWATVSSTAPLNVFSLFDYGPNPPAITGSVGARSTTASTSFRFPIAVGGPLSYNAGMALANPNKSQSSVTVKVYNADGSLNNSLAQPLAANSQRIFLLTQLMNFPAGLFTGSVAVCSDQPVSLVALGVEGGSTGLFTISVTTDPCT